MLSPHHASVPVNSAGHPWVIYHRCGIRNKTEKRQESIDIASRTEDGNFRYEFFLPAVGGDNLLLMEKWRNADTHAAHHLTSHYAMLSELKAEYVTDTIIERFETGD